MVSLESCVAGGIADSGAESVQDANTTTTGIGMNNSNLINAFLFKMRCLMESGLYFSRPVYPV